MSKSSDYGGLDVFTRRDLLDGDARAVIEADFNEITTSKQPRSFTQLVKDARQWIKRQLLRA